MAYRYTSTDKWTDKWFSDLNLLQMLLFMYLCDNCDIAGFINVNIKRWASDLNSDRVKIEGALEGLSRGLIYSKNREVIFIRNFLKHQKNLPINPKNNAHLGIIKRFELYKSEFDVDTLESLLSLENLGATEGLPSSYGNGNGSSNNSSEKFSFKQSLINLGADEKKVSDFMDARKKKKLANTESALSLFIKEAEKVNMTIAEAVEYCAGRSWGGLRAEYLKGEHAGTLPYLTGAAETAEINKINAITDDFQLQVYLSKIQFNAEYSALYHTELHKFISWDTLIKCPKIGKVARDIFTARSINHLLTPATYGQRNKTA